VLAPSKKSTRGQKVHRAKSLLCNGLRCFSHYVVEKVEFFAYNSYTRKTIYTYTHMGGIGDFVHFLHPNTQVIINKGFKRWSFILKSPPGY
jgi:hypothetical protein